MTKVGTIFTELLNLVPRYHFDRTVTRYDGDRYAKSFTWLIVGEREPGIKKRIWLGLLHGGEVQLAEKFPILA